MALIYCPECQKRISSSALTCPECGYPINGAGQEKIQRWSPAKAAVLSLVIPGAGQMYKGQILNGLAWLILVIAIYNLIVLPGFLLHLICVYGAASGDPYY